MKVVHLVVGVLAIGLTGAAGVWGAWCWWRVRQSRWFWILLRVGQAVIVVEIALGGVLVLLGHKPSDLHLLYGLLGPKRPNKTKSEPYECGLPSDVRQSFRFGISFYLIAMLFILFDIEVVFLYPIAVQLQAIGMFALVETVIFVSLLLVAFGYVWRRGALEWK